MSEVCVVGELTLDLASSLVSSLPESWAVVFVVFVVIVKLFGVREELDVPTTPGTIVLVATVAV